MYVLRRYKPACTYSVLLRTLRTCQNDFLWDITHTKATNKCCFIDKSKTENYCISYRILHTSACLKCHRKFVKNDVVDVTQGKEAEQVTGTTFNEKESNCQEICKQNENLADEFDLEYQCRKDEGDGDEDENDELDVGRNKLRSNKQKWKHHKPLSVIESQLDESMDNISQDILNEGLRGNIYTEHLDDTDESSNKNYLPVEHENYLQVNTQGHQDETLPGERKQKPRKNPPNALINIYKKRMRRLGKEVDAAMLETFKVSESDDIKTSLTEPCVEGELDDRPTKVPMPKLENFLPLLEDNEALQKLTDIGVNIKRFQKSGLGTFVLNLDFDKDVLPYLLFLKDTGIPAEEYGNVISKCPFILQENLHNLKVRIDYLRSKKFKKSTIVAMILRDPRFLCDSIKTTDAKLGFYQQLFGLSGREMRECGGSLSHVLSRNPELVKLNMIRMKLSLEFTRDECKQMFMKHSEVYLCKESRLTYTHKFVSEVMEIPNKLIAQFPEVFTSSIHEIRHRHQFLLREGRAQYDPQQPNYVSLKAMIDGDDNTWAMEVAKSTEEDYDNFLRMI